MHLRTRSALLPVVLVATAVLLSGCGLGGGPGTKNASVVVTGNFGSRAYGSAVESASRVPRP